MDENGVRAALRHYADRSAAGDSDGAHEIYTEDAILDFPQSGERFEGVSNLKAWRKDYPAKVDFDLRRVRGAEDVWVTEIGIRYDDGPWNYGVAIYEFRDGKVARETIYYAEPFPAPEWRAAWRAAPPR
ncbi:MAG TPA: nuclear transport factor 2 family protein [Mycobacteriales bacterium]